MCLNYAVNTTVADEPTTLIDFQITISILQKTSD